MSGVILSWVFSLVSDFVCAKNWNVVQLFLQSGFPHTWQGLVGLGLRGSKTSTHVPRFTSVSIAWREGCSDSGRGTILGNSFVGKRFPFWSKAHMKGQREFLGLKYLLVDCLLESTPAPGGRGRLLRADSAMACAVVLRVWCLIPAMMVKAS